ncbi:MAG: molybdate ABC transporter permease subunit [Lachnospiraceae bacterium]|nr:molybdate ABC transporter permease subunit [Lachnospiraceae bacterium]
MDISPLIISFKVSIVATILTTVLALPLALFITGLRRTRQVFDALLSLPLVLPPTVVGFFLLILFGSNSILGRFLERINIDVVFSTKGAVIAAFVISFPIIYRNARTAFEQIDTDLVDAARLMGYDGIRLFLNVYVPLTFHELMTGVIIAFARAIGEFGATIMIAGNIPGRTRTMSVAVYTAMQSGNRELAYMWTVVILLLSFGVLLLLGHFAGRQYRRD